MIRYPTKNIFSATCALSRVAQGRHFASDPKAPSSEETKLNDNAANEKEGWLTRMLKTEPMPEKAVGKNAHSRLGQKKQVFELQFHKVRPDKRQEYVSSYEKLLKAVQSTPDINRKLIGSWQCTVGGDQEQIVNLWLNPAGMKGIDEDSLLIEQNEELRRNLDCYVPFVRQRANQYMLAFSFWDDVSLKKIEKKSVYEMRSYRLKPGSMIEWANHWARAIHIRKQDSAPIGGFFNQVGHMYNVYHLWAYESLEDRRESRNSAWKYPGWDDCVSNTVPLIKEMQTRLMVAMPFSPLK